MNEMRFADFLAKAEGVFRKADWLDDSFVVPPFKDTHVFLLGEDEDFNQALKEIDDDIREEMRERVPMPFKDTTIVSLVRKPMDPGREAQLHSTVREMYPGQVEVSGDLVTISGAPVWVMDRLIEVDRSHPAVQEILRAPGPADMNQVRQWFLMIRFHGTTGISSRPMLWAFGYNGIEDDDRQSIKCVALAVATPLGNEMAESLRYMTAISHPGQYVVRVTPELTPKEQRRVEGGKERPAEKRAHFLVVDHEVIVRLRHDPTSTHASPVPHQRRGHWMRLADRCRHARLLGKTRVWKDDVFVGERTFRDEKNLYEVLLDFGKRKNENA